MLSSPATPDKDGVKTFTCTECGDTKTEAVKYTVVTTVADGAQWDSLFDLTNCTVSGSYKDGGEEKGYTATVADDKCVVIHEESDGNEEFYMFLKDGVWYGGERGSAGLICWESDDTDGITLVDIFELFDFKGEFGSFTYDSGLGAYVAFKNDNYFKVYVEDGKLVKINYHYSDREVPSYTFVFENYGSAVIDSFPEFCFDHTFETEWSYDESAHWHVCATEGCGKTSDYDVHVGGPNVLIECEICGYDPN